MFKAVAKKLKRSLLVIFEVLMVDTKTLEDVSEFSSPCCAAVRLKLSFSNRSRSSAWALEAHNASTTAMAAKAGLFDFIA